MSGQIILDLSSVANLPVIAVGSVHTDPTGKIFQYVKAGGAVAQYDYVSLTKDGNYTATGLTTTTNPITEPALVGCYQGSVALVSGNYAWVQRKGAHTGNVSAATAIGVKMYTTATAGKLSSTSTSVSLINGLTAVASTAGSGSTTMFATLDMATVAA